MLRTAKSARPGMIHTDENLNMEIKELSEKYIKDVADIEKVCFSRPWDQISIAAELKNEFSKFFVAVEDGRAVGYVGMYVLTGEADIVRVAVLPDFRKRGIARAVLEYSLKAADCDVFLDVRESNFAAIGLYRSLGFYDTGVRKNYYSEPEENAVLMKRDAVRGGSAYADSGN